MAEMHMKRRIFLAAAKLFGDKGYAKVSMRDLAAQVNIRAASIYNHYASKEEILEELLDHYVRVALAFANKTQERMQTPGYVPRLEDVAYAYPAEEQELMRSITRILYTEQFTSPLAADALLGERHRRYMQGHELFFEALYRRGIVKRREDAERYADLFSRIGHAFQLEWVHPELEPEGTLYSMYCWLLKLILTNEGAQHAYEAIAGFPLDAPD